MKAFLISTLLLTFGLVTPGMASACPSNPCLVAEDPIGAVVKTVTPVAQEASDIVDGAASTVIQVAGYVQGIVDREVDRVVAYEAALEAWAHDPNCVWTDQGITCNTPPRWS